MVGGAIKMAMESASMFKVVGLLEKKKCGRVTSHAQEEAAFPKENSNSSQQKQPYLVALR